MVKEQRMVAAETWFAAEGPMQWWIWWFLQPQALQYLVEHLLSHT